MWYVREQNAATKKALEGSCVCRTPHRLLPRPEDEEAAAGGGAAAAATPTASSSKVAGKGRTSNHLRSRQASKMRFIRACWFWFWLGRSVMIRIYAYTIHVYIYIYNHMYTQIHRTRCPVERTTRTASTVSLMRRRKRGTNTFPSLSFFLAWRRVGLCVTDG